MPRARPNRHHMLLLGLACSLLVGCASAPRTTTAQATPGAPFPSPFPSPLPSPLALSCTGCHSGPDADRDAVNLDALDADTIAAALHAFRDGRRSGTVMPRLARALTDDDIRQLAHALGTPAK